MSDAVALESLQTAGLETNLTDKLSKPQAADTIYFGELDEFRDDSEAADPSAAIPILATRAGISMRALPLAGEGLTNAGWKFVGAGPGVKEIWGALDTVAGSARLSFVLAHSTDGGQTFELRSFRKPCKLAVYYDFVMSRDGHGRASLSLDTDCGESRAGVYHYETNDDGKTWSANPRYEADAMIRADPVPDDEQPDDTAPAPRTSSMPRSRNKIDGVARVAHISIVHLKAPTH